MLTNCVCSRILKIFSNLSIYDSLRIWSLKNSSQKEIEALKLKPISCYSLLKRFYLPSANIWFGIDVLQYSENKKLKTTSKISEGPAIYSQLFEQKYLRGAFY